jgi:5-methylcytosine-specific restriction endonuclease McrA
MTNNEIKDVLRTAGRLVNTMDKEHAKNLLKILMGAQCKKDCASFIFIDIRKTVRKLLSDLIKTDHINNYLTRKRMKQIFTIMGDYEVYPICKLCGQPIKITTGTNQCGHLDFSWDHKKPKSKGGGYDLANLQPTHKICNNRRGTKPLYSRHYKLKMRLDIDVVLDLDDVCDLENSHYRSSGFGLRKQDSWCHKQCCQKHR